MTEKIKHLEFIQQVINRMASNSFLIKGWTITIIAALFVLAEKDSRQTYLLLAYFPAFFFWFLDGYFLMQERLFRKLYDKTRNQNSTNFSMNTNKLKIEDGYFQSLFSWTLLAFYTPLLIFMLLFMYYII